MVTFQQKFKKSFFLAFSTHSLNRNISLKLLQIVAAFLGYVLVLVTNKVVVKASAFFLIGL